MFVQIDVNLSCKLVSKRDVFEVLLYFAKFASAHFFHVIMHNLTAENHHFKLILSEIHLFTYVNIYKNKLVGDINET